MPGSAFIKIDRLYENEMRARARDAEKDKPIISCGILDFFRRMTGFEPTKYQVALLLDQSQFVVARWSRQSGKSLCLTLIGLYVALSGSNRRIALLAPSLRQSRAMIRRSSSFLPKLPGNALEGRALKTKLEFSNGSTIEAFPNSPETVRGLTLHLLIVDEANYIEDDRELYDAVVYALGTTNGRFIATSTPGSRDSLFYEMCMDDDLYGDFSRHHVSFHDALEPNGPLKKGILEKLEHQMREDPWRWQREMLAEFSEDEEAYFTYGLIDSAVDNSLEYVTDLNKPAAGDEPKTEQ
jgi:Terminase large subunit, T4likevirus-type, N-terminal